MDSILAKTILFFASMLAILNPPDYIKIGSNDLNFDFKTGGNYPIYHYLNVQNVGPGTERFEISSDQSWVSARREGTDLNFVELPPQAYINFVLEIRPVGLADGVNKAKVNLKVLDIDSLVSQEVVLDQVDVSITLNKNIVSPTPTSTGSPQATLVPELSQPVQPEADDLNSILKQLQSIIDSLRILIGKIF